MLVCAAPNNYFIHSQKQGLTNRHSVEFFETAYSIAVNVFNVNNVCGMRTI